MKIKEKIKDINWFEIIILFAIFCAATFVINIMTVGLGGKHSWPSDYPIHIRAALRGNQVYSLLLLVYKVLFLITGNTKLIAIFMGAVFTATVPVVKKLLLEMTEGRKIGTEGKSRLITEICFMAGVSAIFISGLYIPVIHPQFFWNGLTQSWHNGTYAAMRLSAFITMIFFFRIWKNFPEKLRYKEWIPFTVFLTLTNCIKPNFVMAFGPALLALMLWKFFSGRCRCMMRYIILGCGVLISLAVLPIQYAILYSAHNGGGSSAWVFSTAMFIRAAHDWKTVFFVLANIIFPLTVTIFAIKNKRINGFYVFSWLMTAAASIEACFFVESGFRRADGNFLWGIYFALLFLHIMSVERLIDMVKKKDININTTLSLTAIYLIYVAAGFMYFGNIFTGHYYIV